MKEYNYTLDIVDFAYQIIAIHKENEQLRNELNHYKKMHESNCESMNRSYEHTKEMTAIILSATLDPDSIINRGQRAILETEAQS